jgi:hypothetical protein
MANQKTNLTQTVISFKKLSGVANTSMLKTELGENIASNVQIGTNIIFGQQPPASPPTTMYETSSGAIVQRVEFDLVPIFGTTYVATSADSQAESPFSTTHSFALKLKNNYETLGSNNPKVGTPPFTNNYFASGSGGTLQFIPPSFGLDYLVVLKDQNGTQITTGDDMDWYFDYYSGILFRQDGDNTTIPVSGSGYIYIGKYTNEVIASGSSGNGFPFSGSAEITGSLTVSGSGITVDGGTITLITSSITSVSGSISFTTGSIIINTGSITATNFIGTASWAQSASNAVNAQTASFLPVATYNITASWAQSASNAVNAQTASFLPVATYNITASWAQSASNAVNAQTASFLPVGTYNVTASWAQSASNAINSQTASFLPVATYNITASWAQSASNAINARTASFLPIATYNITSSWAQSASNAVNAQTASFLPVATYNITSSWAQSASNAVNAQTASYVNTLNQDVTINGTTSTTNLSVTTNATITGDLTVNGTTTYINVDNLLVEDKFILLNSGSKGTPSHEGGIIVQTTSSEGTAYGTALYYDQEVNRWVVNRSSSVAWDATSNVFSTSSDFIVTVTGSDGAPTGTPVNFGTGNSLYSIGQMYINSNNSDIYIYA